MGPTPPYPQEPARPDSGNSADLFDYRQLKDYLGFIFRGVGRHRLLAGTVFSLTAAGVIALALVLPKTYHVQTIILAQRNQVMASLGNPHRSIPGDSDAPTRAAYETVLRRDNLVSLIKQTNLIDQWEASRAPVLKLKDAVLNAVRGPLDDDDKLDSMIGLLEKRLKVMTDDTSSTVTIAIDWPTAQMAYQLVEAAQQNFLEARHVSEVSAIAEAISILEVHASTVQDTIEQALQEMEKLHEQRKKGNKSGAAAPVAKPVGDDDARRAVARPGSGGDEELAQLKFMIRAKRRSILDLEEFRNRRLTELNSQLAEQKVQYSDQHPNIIDTQQRIDALKRESPQIASLKHDEAALGEEYRRKGGKADPDSLTEPVRRAGRNLENELQAPDLALGDDPATEFARSQLRMASAKHEDLLMRIDAARIELDTARAAFKYRYSVVNPAQLPKKPVKPNLPLVVTGGLFAALLLALFAGAGTDLWRGRLVERWQIERNLELPVLAEVKRS